MAEEKQGEVAQHEGKAPESFNKKLKRELLSWLWVILAFLFIQGTMVQARVIPSQSMEDTLLVGDHLLVSRIGYDAEIPFTGIHKRLWRDPKRQQIMVFRMPGQSDFVKRVIGLPGDVVEIKHGAVWVNGMALVEPYLKDPQRQDESFGPITVPPESYFMMGDNRHNSNDSRYWVDKFVPRDALIGTPLIIYLSIDAPTENAWQPGQLNERLKAYGKSVVEPSRIRFRRMFTAP